MTPQKLCKEAMKEFELAKRQFGMQESMWIPFKQSFYKAYDLGSKQDKN